MIRPILTELMLFLVPFALYAVFLFATQAKILHPENWAWQRIASLTIAALILILGSFIYFANYSGAPVGTTYIPAHMENRKFVPGTTR